MIDGSLASVRETSVSLTGLCHQCSTRSACPKVADTSTSRCPERTDLIVRCRLRCELVLSVSGKLFASLPVMHRTSVLPREFNVLTKQVKL